MPPKNAKKPTPKQHKSKKQVEEDEFEKLLSDLKKATKTVGTERQRQEAEKNKARAERERKREEIMERKKTNSVEAALLRRQQQLKFQEILQQLMAAQHPFLTKPVTDIHVETNQSNSHFDVAVGEMQGWRSQMEDAHVVDVAEKNGNEGIFMVCDGHSGKKAAELCRQHFPRVLRSHKSADNTINFEASFAEMDEILRKELAQAGDESGCTAVIVHVTDDKITGAWVGDSRAVVCQDGVDLPLAHDHKPENPEERERIEGLGGFVRNNRVNGELAMSRAMGDFKYKTAKERPIGEQLVIAVPDVVSVPRDAKSAFVVLACDGIFDVLSNEELIEFVSREKAAGHSNKEIVETICNHCLAPPDAENPSTPSRPDGTDNMTLMIVDLK